MSHDFDDSHGGTGGPCDNTGIMSYGSTDYTGWSICSRSDFEKHYASRNWANCLEDISGKIFFIRFTNSNGTMFFMVGFYCKSTFKVFIIFVGTTDEETTAAPSTAAPTTAAPTTTGPPAGGMRIFIRYLLTAGIYISKFP